MCLYVQWSQSGGLGNYKQHCLLHYRSPSMSPGMLASAHSVPEASSPILATSSQISSTCPGGQHHPTENHCIRPPAHSQPLSTGPCLIPVELSILGLMVCLLTWPSSGSWHTPEWLVFFPQLCTSLEVILGSKRGKTSTNYLLTNLSRPY